VWCGQKQEYVSLSILQFHNLKGMIEAKYQNNIVFFQNKITPYWFGSMARAPIVPETDRDRLPVFFFFFGLVVHRDAGYVGTFYRFYGLGHISCGPLCAAVSCLQELRPDEKFSKKLRISSCCVGCAWVFS
jgi:hypothetical protein